MDHTYICDHWNEAIKNVDCACWFVFVFASTTISVNTKSPPFCLQIVFLNFIFFIYSEPSEFLFTNYYVSERRGYLHLIERERRSFKKYQCIYADACNDDLHWHMGRIKFLSFSRSASVTMSTIYLYCWYFFVFVVPSTFSNTQVNR